MAIKKEHPSIRIAKLHSKLSNQDHLIFVDKFSPEQTSKKNHGILLFVIDIYKPTKDSQQVIDTLVKTTIKFFYDKTDDTLNSFELTLRHVNEKLATLAEEGNSHWINNMSSLIAVIKKHDIHITQTGTAEAFLIRNKIISHITEGLSEKNDEKHPLNTFVNISSGKLQNSDRVILSSEQLYNNLSLDRIRRLAIQHTPTTCIAEIARILAQENIRSVGSIVIEATTEEKMAKEIIKPQPEDVILQDRKQQGTKFSNLIDNSKSFFQKITQSIQKINSPQRKKTVNTKSNIRLPKNPPPSIPKKDHKLNSNSNNILQKLNQKPANRNILIVILIVLLIAVLGISITYLRNKQNINSKISSVQTQLDQIQSLVNEAENAMIIGDKTNARQKYNQAQDLLFEIKSSPYLAEEISSLENRISAKIDEADNLVRIDLTTPLADLNSISQDKFTHLFKIDENLYSFSKNIASINTNSGKITNITGFDIQNFVGGSTTNESSTITFYHNGLMQRFSPSSNSLQDISTLDNSWKPAVEINSYYDNIYLLSPIENQIFKYSSLGGSDYSSLIKYINNPNDVDLSNATSLTIDGSIYVTKHDGKIYKFLQGDMVNFEIKNIPEPHSTLANPNQIYTDENIDYLFISDPANKRIVQFNKETGQYIKQFANDDIGNIDSFVINDKIKTIYILADNKIYSANY